MLGHSTNAFVVLKGIAKLHSIKVVKMYAPSLIDTVINCFDIAGLVYENISIWLHFAFVLL